MYLWIRFVRGSMSFLPSRGSSGVNAPNWQHQYHSTLPNKCVNMRICIHMHSLGHRLRTSMQFLAFYLHVTVKQVSAFGLSNSVFNGSELPNRSYHQLLMLSKKVITNTPPIYQHNFSLNCWCQYCFSLVCKWVWIQMSEVTEPKCR